MDLTRTIIETIDMRSFSNLWFWIALAVMWSTASHWVIGVPWDMVLRARRKGGAVQQDVEDLARIYTSRLLYIGRVSGTWLMVLVTSGLSGLWVLGFWYGIQFCQAVFLLACPMSLVGLMSLRVARRIEAGENAGDALYRRLRLHRFNVQAVGIASIFFTALWGMFQNLSASVLGN
ncbi:MAG: component of SufBCD complex [Rhodobacterales bacterium]|nr:component of SufBCD complex [Rhodobacterales bacterium]MDX5500259.1 component of SufBCD complex [Rhodobacterales bacterium]